MNERAFRFDLLIAVCALLASSVVAIASVYQTKVFRDQYAATIWPYLALDDTTNVRGKNTELFTSAYLTLTNNGLGPALIRSADLSIDGKQQQTWADLRNLAEREAHWDAKNLGHMHGQLASVNASTTIRPGDSRRIFGIEAGKGVPIAVLTKHNVTIDVCYCSLNDRCWVLDTKLEQNTPTFPQTVDRCTVGPHIDSTNV